MPLEPPPPPIPPAETPGQFSLAALLTATAIAAVMFGLARLLFAAQGELEMWIMAPVFGVVLIYICLRLPFILTAVARRRDYYRALQRHRAELAAWMEERKSSR